MINQLIQQFLAVKLTSFQIYLLWFLLGSFAVATLSDLKYLSAQREFVEIWIIFTLAMFFTDLYYHRNLYYLVLKWTLIFIFLPLYFRFRYRVARGDILAKMAACSLFSPILIIIFIILVGFIDHLTRYFWVKLLKKQIYPFMPTIFLTTLILLLLVALR